MTTTGAERAITFASVQPKLRLAWASRLRSTLTGKASKRRFAQQVQALSWQHQVASRPPTAERGFVPMAQRWGVERTFAWLNCFRPIVIGYERQPASHAAWLLLANLSISLQRVTHSYFLNTFLAYKSVPTVGSEVRPSQGQKLPAQPSGRASLA